MCSSNPVFDAPSSWRSWCAKSRRLATKRLRRVRRSSAPSPAMSARAPGPGAASRRTCQWRLAYPRTRRRSRPVRCAPCTRFQAWTPGAATGRGVKVAIVDSGIDAAHPAVGGAVNAYVAISLNGEEISYETGPHDDAVGHGTACAAIVRQLAPECELISVKVLGPRLGGRGAVFTAGIRWALQHGVDVCNLSLGTSKADFFGPLHDLADEAYFHNIILVAAANNMPVPTYPALYASVISVAACDGEDPDLFFYNPEPPVEFGAPGINIRVAWR